MVPELGYLSLIVALAFSILLAVLPLWGAQQGHVRLMQTGPRLAIAQFLFTIFSFGCLMWASYHDDFTVAYVAYNSSISLPWYYKLTSTWGAHEGAMLLWVVMQSGWTAMVGWRSQSLPWLLRARVLGVLGILGLGFYLFTLVMSNPFERLLPYYPVDGRDLNPLLQDPGMIIHPPLLYMGYVGFSVSFAFAIAALLTGKLDNTWAKWSRPWTIAAWIFLTLGIAIGSWWAYAELGWGGWWFWDPVENASLMPWLIGTALIHSLAVTDKRGTFKSWTVLLAIAAFSLSLLGTFLVRSGVIVSVHAFATDPGRGLFLLTFLGIVIAGSLLLYGLRASSVNSVSRYSWFSREVALWGNNILLVAATLIVLLGTLIPLVHKEIGLGSISIGVPFFNQMFTLLIVPFAMLLALGPLVRWKQQPAKSVLVPFLTSGLVALVIGYLWIYLWQQQVHALALLGTVLAVWIFISTLYDIFAKSQHFGGFWTGVWQLNRSQWSMVFGHVGFVVTLVGIALTSHYTQERDVRMQPGDTVQLYQYQFRFDSIKKVDGPNYEGHGAVVSLWRDGEKVDELKAEKRFYHVKRTVMTEVAVERNLVRDLYVALGEQLDDGAWALRLYYKPYVGWLWLGAFIMAFGGLLALTDKRYRQRLNATRTGAAS